MESFVEWKRTLLIKNVSGTGTNNAPLASAPLISESTIPYGYMESNNSSLSECEARCGVSFA